MEKNDGAKTFSEEKNDRADTFLGNLKTGLGLFNRKRMTGRRLFMEWIRTILLKSIENIPLQAYFSELENEGAKTFFGERNDGV